jgi:hypothetical protein
MPELATLAASQDVVIKTLFAAAAVAILAAFLSYSLRGRHVSLKPPPRSLVIALLPIILAVAVAYALAANGPAVRQVLTTAAHSGRSMLPTGPAQLPTFNVPPPAPSDTPLRQALAQVACNLLLQEKRVVIAGMDACIAAGTQNPADVYKYITGESLGASWDALSDNEKQIAVDKATTDGNGPHQAAQRDAAFNAYMNCLAEIGQKSDAYIRQQCPADPMDALKYMDCSAKIQASAYYQQHFTCKAPY